jgi:hypothetical protein
MRDSTANGKHLSVVYDIKVTYRRRAARADPLFDPCSAGDPLVTHPALDHRYSFASGENADFLTKAKADQGVGRGRGVRPTEQPNPHHFKSRTRLGAAHTAAVAPSL